MAEEGRVLADWTRRRAGRERVARELRALRARALGWAGVLDRARSRLDGSRAAVLTYHRILPAADARARAVEPGMYVTPETFAHHLEWLAAELRVLPLGEVAQRLRQNLPLPPGAVALTFDDGWRDNYDHAFPQLERRGLPATVFLVTDRVGTAGGFWPDEVCRRLAAMDRRARRRVARRLGAAGWGDAIQSLLRHLKELPEDRRDAALDRLHALTPGPAGPRRELLDPDEIDRMRRSGIDFEAHGATHRILTAAPAETAREELARSRAWLQEHGLGRRELFAYPSGAWDLRVRALVAEAGFRAAFTTERALASPSCDPLRLPRVGLHQDISATRRELLHALARAG